MIEVKLIDRIFIIWHTKGRYYKRGIHLEDKTKRISRSEYLFLIQNGTILNK